MFRKLLRLTLLSSLCTGIGLVHADEGAVRQGMDAFVGPGVVESVTSTPYGGLYEVVLANGELVYTDERVSFIIDGRIIDTMTRRDVTQERLTQLSAIDFAALPLDHAFKQVKGNGTRVIATFEDPNCGYCKRLAQEFVVLDDVTIYTFLYPILGADSTQKSRDIWCAKDQAKAWNDWILDNKTPPSASCDSAVVDSNVALGRKLRIQGTPTIFLANGQRLGGYLPAAQLEQVLSNVSE